MKNLIFINYARLSLRLAIILFVISVFSGCATSELAWDNMVLSQRLFKEGRYDEAIGYLRQATEVQPDFVLGWYWLASSYYQKARYDEAIYAYNRALGIAGPQGFNKKQLADIYEKLGLINYFKNNYDESIKNFNNAIGLEPTDPDLYRGKARAYSGKGNYKEAIKNFNKTIEIRPQDQFALSGRGWAYFNDNKPSEAIKDFKKVIELKPKNNEALRGRGFVYYAMGRYDEAIADFDRAIETSNKKDANSYMGRGWSRNKKGDYTEAIRDFNKAYELNTKDNSPVYGKVFALKKRGEYDEAIRDYNRLLDLNPKEGAAFLGRGWCYYFKGDYNSAIKDFNKAIENISPNNKNNLVDANRGKAFSYLGLGDSETAIGLIKKAKEIIDYDTDYDMSLIYYVLGEKDKVWRLRGGQGFIGITTNDYKHGTTTGVKVESVVDGGPAKKANILAGDVIVRIDNQFIENQKDFFDKAKVLRPGKRIKIKILREGIEKELPLIVGSADLPYESEPMIAPILAKTKGRSKVAELASSTPRDSYQSDENLPPLRGDTHAIIIGIDYKERKDIPHLQYASQDAKKVYEALTDQKYGGVPKENIIFLLNEKATRNEMITALRRIKAWDGYIYVYYSGHGAPKTKEDKLVDALLVPNDVIITDPESMEETAIKISYLKDLVDSSNAKGVMVAIDACFSGGGKSIVPKGGKPLVGMLASQDIIKPGGTGKVIITSSAINQQSWEDEQELKSGIFSHYFIEGIQGRAGNDAWVKINDLAFYIKENVTRAARRLKGVEQTPQVSGQGDFPVSRNWEKARLMDIDMAKSKLKAAFEKGSINSTQLNRAIEELTSNKRSKTLEAFLENKISEKSFGELY